MFLEGGALKRFYWRQFILSAGFKVGYLMGFLTNHPAAPNNVPSQATIGLTGLVGLHYQATPDLLLGLDLGWRYYPNEQKNQWTFKKDGTEFSVNYPQIGSNGPIFNIFGTYAF